MSFYQYIEEPVIVHTERNCFREWLMETEMHLLYYIGVIGRIYFPQQRKALRGKEEAAGSIIIR